MDGFDGTLWTMMIMDGRESCKAFEKSMEVIETAHRSYAFGPRAFLYR